MSASPGEFHLLDFDKGSAEDCWNTVCELVTDSDWIRKL